MVMDESHQVITSFVIQAGQRILAQGSFQVLAEPGFSTFESADGASFLFKYSYRSTVCLVDVSCRRQGVIECSRSLEIPINRTKRRWKKTRLGATYRLYFRSGFERTTRRDPGGRGSPEMGPHLMRSPEDV